MNVKLLCILDRSGSMGPLRLDTIGGFNRFLREQKSAPGAASLTLVLFDHEYLVPIRDVDIKLVAELTEATYEPRGWTALLDAVGRAVSDARSANRYLTTKPDKTIVMIVTDGQENDSKEWTLTRLKQLIRDAEAEGFEFLYLGANQDSFMEASKMGIHSNATTNYAHDSHGIRAVFASASGSATTSRGDVGYYDKLKAGTVANLSETTAQADDEQRKSGDQNKPPAGTH